MSSCLWAKLRPESQRLPNALRCVALTICAWWSRKDVVAKVLLELIIPFAAGAALLASGWLAVCQVRRSINRSCKGEKRPVFSRKGLVVSVTSLFFAASCFYRALFVADEGAGLCRSAPSIFNAPVSGRLVATVGEIALVVQISSYIMGTARRLGAGGSFCAGRTCFTYVPVLTAECLSWCGVLSGITKFFCLEYMMWMLLAATWTCDTVLLLLVSQSSRDVIGHTCLLLASVGLLVFNSCFEIPHFFSADGSAAGALESAFECRQDMESPIWTKRLPFFFAYFLVCSWCSVAISYRMFKSYGWRNGQYSKPSKTD